MRPVIMIAFQGQVRQFLEGSEALEFMGLTVKEKYYWI